MPTQHITISAASSPADAENLLQLIDRLADFEKLTPPDSAARERFVQDGFVRKPPRFEALLASVEGDDEPCGYAVFFETYSSFLCRPTLYLEDLFVLPERRKHGVGLAILKHLALEASGRGCGRMEWTCLEWNVNAQRFYDRIGAKHMKEWLFYRMDAAAIGEFTDGE